MSQQPQSDPFLDALDAVQAPAGDPFLDALNVAQGHQQAASSGPAPDHRSIFSRAYDALFTPPEFVVRGAQALSDRIAPPTTLAESEALNTRPVVHAAGRGTAFSPEQARSVVAGAVQGAANLLTPGDIALTAATFGEGAAARQGLQRTAQALHRFQRAASAGQMVRGAERTINAQSVPEAAAGVAETALGGLGYHAGRVPEPAPRPEPKALPPGARFVGTPAGDVVPAGTAIPMEQAADGSFVRGVPAEYARHEVRGELPPGPRFIAGEGGIVGEAGQTDEVLAALDAAQGRGSIADGGRRIEQSAGQPLFFDVADARRQASAVAEQIGSTPEQVLRDFGLDTRENVSVFNEHVIDQYVEPPARDLVRQLLAERKRPYSSNAYGPGERGVWWEDANGRKGFSPLTTDTSSVRSTPAAVVDREIDPFTPARGSVRVRQYSGDVNATDAPFVNDEQRTMLRRMRADLETFQPVQGRLIRSEGSAVKDTYSRGAAGSAVGDDVRTISEQHVGNGEIVQAIDDVLAGKAPSNRLHTSVIDAAQGYIEGRPGYRGPEITAEAAARTGPSDAHVSDGPQGAGVGSAASADADFERFSQEWDAIAGEHGGGFGSGEAGFVSPDFLVRAAGGAVGGAIGASGSDKDESPYRRAARIGLGAIAGAAAPSLFSRGGGARAARVVDAAVPRLAPRVVAEAAPRPRAFGSGTPKADPLAGMDPLFAKFNPIVRDGIKQVITENAGFDAARRGSIDTRTLGKFANEVKVHVDRVLPKGTPANAETITAMARALQKTTQKVSDLAALVNSGKATDADLIAFKIAQEEQRNVAQSFTAARTEAGRALAALNFWGGVLDSGDVDLIRKVATPLKEEAARIAKGIAALPEDPLTRYRWLQQQQAVSPWSYLRTYYTANLLSGPLTQFRNFVGNLSNAIADTATLPVAAGIDAAKSAIRGTQRTVRLSELPSTAAGSVVGLEKGFQDAMFALREGLHPAELSRSVDAAVTRGKLDLAAPELPGGGLNPLNWPFRAMSAADALARTTAYEGELSAILFNQAKNEGLSGQKLLDRVAELRASMNPEAVAMRTQAAQYAAHRVFLEEPGDITKRVTLLAQSIPGSYFVLPFIKISSSIARQGAEFSPVGFLMKTARTEGRAGTHAQARATAGSLAAGYFFWLASTGRITGDGPSDSTERNALYERGWRPNSVKVGDKWYGYQAISPINIPMAAIANAVEAWKFEGGKPQQVQDVIAQTFARLSNTFLESTFLQGAFNLVEALKDPERNAARFFGQTAFGLIPGSSALRTIQRATDPVQRQPQGVAENIKAGLPGLSKEVPARITRFGEPVTREGGPARRALDPFMSSAEKHDLIAEELSRLEVDLTVPAGRLTVNGQPLTREESQQLKVQQGQAVRTALETLIDSDGYATLSDDARAAAITKQVGKTRARVNDLFRRATQRSRARGAEGTRLNGIADEKFERMLPQHALTRAEILAIAQMFTDAAGRPVSYREARAEAIRRGVQVQD